MVTFELTVGGHSVKVNDKPFGFISGEHGFFTDPTVVREFLEVSASDLRRIAEEVDRVKGLKS